jgi:RHS repeat-associated protein
LEDRPKTVTDEYGLTHIEGTEPTENITTWVFEEGSFRPAAKITEDKNYSIITDYLGTPVQMYDEKGEKTWEMELDIYGKVRTFAGRSLSDCPFRWQGQYEDSETGLYYNRHRYYDPEMGCYLSQDPIRLAGNNPTLYGYVKDPNSWVDVFGLDCGKNKKTHYDGKSRRDAFRQAKRDAGIPMNQQPKAVKHVDLDDGFGNKISDANGKTVQAREYHYIDSKGKEIIIQEHSMGHPKASPTDPASNPHFNVRPIDKPRTGHVKGTHGHYNF